MKDNKTKVITIAVLAVAVIALSIGFAAFSSSLNINTSASVTPTNTFSVKFASGVTGANGEFTQFSVTPTVAVTSTSDNGAIAGTPEIDNSDVRNPSIGNLSASFTQPGQSVTYTFYVVNDGNYDAYLTNLVFNNAQGASSFRDCVSDSLSSNPATQTLVNSVCSNITFTMSVGSTSNITSTTTLNNHLLEKNHYEQVTVTIAYTGEAYADGAFNVNFGDIDLNYRTIDEPEVVATDDSQNAVAFQIVAPGKTLNTLELNDEIILGNEHFTFISMDENTVTMFAKYNLNVGNYPYGGSATNSQEPNALGSNTTEIMNGGVFFHSTSDVSFTPMSDVSNLSSYTINQYLVNYDSILESMLGISDISVTLPGNDELLETGLCSMQGECNLVYDTSFWTKFAYSNTQLIAYLYQLQEHGFGFVGAAPTLDNINLSYKEKLVGVRPVITVPKSAFE